MFMHVHWSSYKQQNTAQTDLTSPEIVSQCYNHTDTEQTVTLALTANAHVATRTTTHEKRSRKSGHPVRSAVFCYISLLIW